MNSSLVLQCERELIGFASYVWYNDQEFPGPIAVYRDDSSGLLELTPAESPSEACLRCDLIDFSAQINNLVYLHVEEEDVNISVAFSSISAVHNTFLKLCPYSADQVRTLVFVYHSAV